MARIDPNKLALEERVVQINRVAKVVKGGRRFSFSAVVVVGDGAGHVGVGPRQGRRGARGDPQGRRGREEEPHPDPDGRHDDPARGPRRVLGAARVLLKPASQGTGVIAGGSVRAVVEAAGIRDILSKIHGSTNPVNVTRATIEALRSLHSAEELAGAAASGRAAARQAWRRGARRPHEIRAPAQPAIGGPGGGRGR